MESDLLRIEEAAQYLTLKPSTLRTWIWKKKIAYVKMGRGITSVIRFRRCDLDAFIQAGRVEARQQTIPT